MDITEYSTIQGWKAEVAAAKDLFIEGIPKIELHVHVEGTMTASLRWRLAQRNKLSIHSSSRNKTYSSLEELSADYNLLNPQQPRSTTGSKKISAFFDAYYGSMDVLRTEEDFYDLAMDQFTRASKMNVRYCEVFFDPQAHTRRGIDWAIFMSGLRRASLQAKEELNIKSQYIMCFLRDAPLVEATQHYEAALAYRDMIVGIGLDSNEYDRPPSLFYELFTRARADGFKITAHCDVTQKDCHEHIRQVLCSLGGSGADRCDHGLDAADQPELMALARQKQTAFTICPWAYVRHVPAPVLFESIRILVREGVRVTISSDSPAYMEEQWIEQNLKLARLRCGFTDEELLSLQKNAVGACWASEQVKREMMDELEAFYASSR
ncbi:adenosine deaminase [Phlyctema vagabunda]|uniref:Adenosine deaminase n=1 Tax=Phlyctema vagabunda TaxID=108571 RepID=A0ABR4PVK9_9HELO